MNNKSLKEIINEIAHRNTMKSDDIPSIDLYMDQIMSLFDTHLKEHKRYEDDKLLTKTMINNYSKEGIIKPIKGKKYSKDHIIQMLLVYSLKNTISISEIKEILISFHNENENTQLLYDRYQKLSKELIQKQSENYIEFVENNHLDIDNYENLALLILTLSSLSQFYQTTAQSLIDQFYLENKKRKS